MKLTRKSKWEEMNSLTLKDWKVIEKLRNELVDILPKLGVNVNLLEDIYDRIDEKNWNE